MKQTLRITIIMVILFQSLTTAFAQTNSIAQKIEQFKNNGGSFKETTLTILNNAPQGRTDGSLFQLDRKQLTELSRSESSLQLSVPDGKNGSLTVELVPYQVVTDNFILKHGNTVVTSTLPLGKHYRGIVKNDNNSQVAISFFENELRGTIRSATGSFSIEKAVEGVDVYRVKNSKQEDNNAFACETKDDGKVYAPEQLSSPFSKENGRISAENVLESTVVRLYLEVDASITNHFGDIQSTVNFATSIFNESFLLYQNESVTMQLSEVVIWDNSTTPYVNTTNSSDKLNGFQKRTDGMNGDLGHLIFLGSSGIAAGFDGLCNANVDKKLCVSGVNPADDVIAFPAYSWNVKVITHEMGHLLGSRHTHACVWNGNGTAIDGCAGDIEGSCILPPLPANGGTIMSYCHRQDNMNFSLGFGEQPGNVIRNNVMGAQCLNTTSQPATTYCTLRPKFSNSYIDKVDLNGIIKTSGADGYSDYTTQTPINVTAGATSTITLQSQALVSSDIAPWRVWIDYNRNYRFDPSEELSSLIEHYPSARQTSTTFVVPQWAYSGVTRMRVIYSPNDYATPCEIFEQGEVEDYAVKIINNNLSYGDAGASLINKVVGSDRFAGDSYGYAVSLSGDYAVATAPKKESSKGVAYILKKGADGKWIQHQIITASDRSVGDNFGYAVAMTDNVILVGAPYDDANTGAVYVFRKNPQTGNWAQIQKLTARDKAENQYFGVSVSMMKKNAVIGSNASTTTNGAAYVFTTLGITWEQAQKLESPDSKPGARFGTSVSINESASYIVVGATLEDTNVSGEHPLAGAGGAYVFAKSGRDWIFQQKLVSPARYTRDYFGTAIDITEEKLVIGTPGYDANGFKNSGAAYVFLKNDKNMWEYNTQFISTDPREEDGFGNSVSVSGDYVLIGTAKDDLDWTMSTVTRRDAGAAFLFKKHVYLQNWVPTRKMTPSDRTSNDYFGQSVGLEKDQIIIGSINTDINESGTIVSNAGGAYFYKIENYSAPVDPMQTFTGQPGFRLAYRCDIEGNHAVATTSGLYEGMFYFYEQNGANQWSNRQEIKFSSPSIEWPPLVTPHAKLADANTAVVFLREDSKNLYTYSFVNGQWLQTSVLTTPLINTNSINVISANGDDMVIGNLSSGTYFYERKNGQWSPAGSSAASYYEMDIANGIAVGYRYDGAALFRKGVSSGLTQWSFSEEIRPSSDKKFTSIAIGSDGQAYIGYRKNDGSSIGIYQYDCSTSPCIKVSTIDPPSELGLTYFSHIQISGNVLLVGGSTNDSGYVLTYEKNSNGTWNYKNALCSMMVLNGLSDIAISGNAAMVAMDDLEYGSVLFYDLTIPKQPTHNGPRTQESILQSNQLANSFAFDDTANERWASAYPNPAENILNLDVTLEENEQVQVRIFSTTGEVRFAEEFQGTHQLTINDFASYASGIYLVKITTAKRSETIKVLKK